VRENIVFVIILTRINVMKIVSFIWVLIFLSESIIDAGDSDVEKNQIQKQIGKLRTFLERNEGVSAKNIGHEWAQLGYLYQVIWSCGI
jgi:hypothetical protein